LFDVHPERKKEIEQDGGSHGKESQINKVHPDSSCSYPPLSSQVGTYPENLPLDEIFKAVHVSECKKNCLYYTGPLGAFHFLVNLPRSCEAIRSAISKVDNGLTGPKARFWAKPGSIIAPNL
jgi:hypothetical protein